MSDDQILVKPHSSKQESVIFSDSKITVAGTGIQWGKTKSGALWLKRLIHTYPGKDNNFIICAPTYKILEQSTLPAFLSVMEGYGEYNYSKAQFKLFSGAVVYCRTNKDPDSIVGMTNVRAIWGDEAGKYTLYFWQNIQGRASFMNCPILLTTSPYTLNWIYKDIIKPYRQGLRPDIHLVQAASRENPYFSQEAYELAKRTMDPRRFNMMYGGEWGRMEGIVYDCFDEDQNICHAFDLPPTTRFVAGVDWGYNPDPFVCVVRAITPGGDHYQVSEFHKTGMTITDIKQYCKQTARTWGIQAFFCDPSQPGYIAELTSNGVPALPSENDITRGIGLHYELIKTRRYKVWKETSPYTLDEYETYHYPEPKDLGPDDNQKEQKPVDQSNHCMDANRYVTLMTYRSRLKLTPLVPSDQNKAESQEQRLARLKKTKRYSDAWG